MQTYVVKLENLLQYIEVENKVGCKNYRLLVDSGAQLNIIKKNNIAMSHINNDEQILISGITPKAIKR